MSRLSELLGFLVENRDITHPDGCQAVTGFYDDPQRIAWSSNNRCPYSHPQTLRGLRVQYARQGWTDLGTPPGAA